MIDLLITGGRLVLGLLLLQAVGYSWLALLTRSSYNWRPVERLSLAYGLGALGLTWWQLLLTFFRIPFSLGTILLPWLPVLLSGGYVASKRGWFPADCRFFAEALALLFRDWRQPGRRWESLLAWLLVLFLVFGTLRAIVYPLWEWDALATWGLKAKAFYLARTIDLSRFEAHNYYPNLVPLLFTYLYFWLGGVVDSLVKLTCPLWGAACLGLFYGLLRRHGLNRRWSLVAALFLVSNGATFLSHLFLAYADLPLAFYQLALAGLLWQRLVSPERPAGVLLPAILAGGLAWCKYEGWPLALILFLAAALTLLWLRPAGWPGQLLTLGLILLGAYLATWPWRLFVLSHDIAIGVDHWGGLRLHQLVTGLAAVLQALFWPPYFGIWWPVVLGVYAWAGRELFSSPWLFLALQTAGNLAAVVLAYAVVPAAPAEFPLYIRATVDRLLLHFLPAAGLILAWLTRLAENHLTGETGWC